MDGSADHDLMARVAQGDERAFQELVQRYVERATALARRIVKNSGVAEELAQEAFLRVWLHAHRWRPESSFRAWFYRIIVNLCLSERRRASPLPLEAAGDPTDPAPDPADNLQTRERDRLVAAAIDALPARQRAAIVLTYHEGLSNAEAAAVLDTSVSAVENLLVRAKQSLRAALASTRD